jgi:sRNA-binding protein
VAELTTRAEQSDAQAAKETLDLPAELARREKRIESLKHARQIIETQAKEMAAAQQVEHQAKVAERQAQRDAGKKPRGPEPKAPDDKPEAKAQYNFTDPESRIMKAGNGKHFEQAYNAQAVVDEAMLIVGQRVSVAANDKQELAATVQAISPVVKAEVNAVLADSGFYSEAAVRAVEQPRAGTASGLTVYAAVDQQSHHKSVADLLPQPEPPTLPETASAKEKMAHRLKTSVGKTLYKLRKQTVEPVFGIIKEVLGFRRFLLRGKEKVSLEWLLVCLSYNLKRLFTLKNLVAAG